MTAKNETAATTDAKDIPAQNTGEVEVEETVKDTIVCCDDTEKSNVLNRIKAWALKNKKTIVTTGSVLGVVAYTMFVTSNKKPKKQTLELEVVVDAPAEDTDSD